MVTDHGHLSVAWATTNVLPPYENWMVVGALRLSGAARPS
jgi:hypothetical protein